MYQTAFVLLCAAYLVLLGTVAAVPAAALKVLPILALVARAASRAPGRQRLFLSLGLLFSLAGDLVLALSPQRLFVLGVAAFLAAHVLYIAAFASDVRYTARSAVFAGLAVSWCAAAAWVIVPHLGSMTLPVLAYMVVIAAMGVTSAFASAGRVGLFAGALAFIVSDSILALDRFVAHVEQAPYLVMTTYYFGQFFIVEGIVGRGSPRDRVRDGTADQRDDRAQV